MIPDLLLKLKTAADSTAQANCLQNSLCHTGLPKVGLETPQLQQILEIVFGVMGALAILFIVIGGFRYVISGGDPQDTAKARSTIIYALVGLAVAIAAEAIVAFVLNRT